MRNCQTCGARWIKPGNFEEWWCRLDKKPIKRIGDKRELAESKGCSQWRS